jgi:hypothetical protein
MSGVKNMIAILEDNADRIAEMRACLSERIPAMEVIFFEDAGKMIVWLRENLGDVRLISLDHDLPLIETDGRLVDSGTGRQVADFLAKLPATCPVIVHSSNDQLAPGMCFALKDAGWPQRRVYPCDDLAWIRRAWMRHVRKLLA